MINGFDLYLSYVCGFRNTDLSHPFATVSIPGVEGGMRVLTEDPGSNT